MSLQCQSCFTGSMEKPLDNHPSYIVCPNCGALELTYKPMDYQEDMHNIPYVSTTGDGVEMQIIFVAGGYGSGKSKATLSEVVLRALENPNGTGLLTAPTLQQLKRTTIKTFFNEVCPPPLVERYNKTDGEIELINGFVFYTIPSDDEEKLRSINAGIIHMEEASGIKRSIYDQLLTRMRDPFVKNRTMFVCTNPDLGYVKEVFADNPMKRDPSHPQHSEYNPYIHTFIWRTSLNTHLPPDFIAINSHGKPAWWIKRYLEGSFNHSEGMVYPNFANVLTTRDEYFEKHELTGEKILAADGMPKSWERFVTLDHGLRNPTAVLFNAINPKTGEVVTYDEYYVPNRLVPDHAKEIKPKIESIPLGRIRFMVADPSIRNKTDPVNGKSVQGLYQEYGMFFTEGNNSIEAGVLKVNSYIERGKWKVFKDKCPAISKEGLNYKFEEVSMDNAHENLDERPVKANDHAMDSIRYGFMRLPDDPDLLKSESFMPPSNYNSMQKSEYMFTYNDEDEGNPKDYLSYV